MNDFRALNMDIFNKAASGKVLFQPRCDFWISENKRLGTIPDRYVDLLPSEIHDDLGCSIRPYKAFNPCFKRVLHGVEVEERVIFRDGSNRRVLTRFRTPHRDLDMVTSYTENAHHVEQWPVRGVDDYAALEYVLRRERVIFDAERYREEDRLLGNRAAPQVFIPRVNIMKLMVHWMGVEGFMLGLINEPRKTEVLIHVIDEQEEHVLREVAGSPVPIVNYGDNIDCNLAPPHYLERYVIPQYHRRTEVLRAAGKFVHSHFDGSMRSLLPLFRELPLDGIEALTPLPQGDVSLESYREAVPRGMVVLDMLPMTFFLPDTPLEALDAAVERVIELFAPELILGVSDEVSPLCDIERVRRVAEFIARLNVARGETPLSPTGTG